MWLEESNGQRSNTYIPRTRLKLQRSSSSQKKIKTKQAKEERSSNPRVSASRFSTGTRKHFELFYSTPPKTHCPSTRFPRWYFPIILEIKHNRKIKCNESQGEYWNVILIILNRTNFSRIEIRQFRQYSLHRQLGLNVPVLHLCISLPPQCPIYTSSDTWNAVKR